MLGLGERRDEEEKLSFEGKLGRAETPERRNDFNFESSNY